MKCNESTESSTISIQLTTDNKLPYDPTTTGFAHITFYNAVLGRLVRLNSNLTVQPGLLEDAFWDFKNEQYILRLRKNLKFHNGRKVTIEDLDFSLVRFFLSTNRVDQVAFLKHIRGIDKLTRGKSYKAWSVDGIKKIDDDTLAISLVTPNPAFLYGLADGWVSLVPKEEFQSDLVTWKSVPVGAGSYKVQSINDHRVRVCKTAVNDQSPNALEFISSTVANADVIGFTTSDFSGQSLKKVYGSGPIGFTGLFFNSSNELAAHPSFRKALSLAIQRKEIIGDNKDFTPLTEMLTSNFYGRLKPIEKFDLEAAKKELRKVPASLLKRQIKAHWFSGRKNLSLSDKTVINSLINQMRQIGLEIVFRASPHPTFSASDTETVLRIDDRGTAFPDPLVIFRAFERPAFLSPFFPKDNSKLKSLLHLAAEARSINLKSKAISSLSNYFYENTIVIPLYERKVVYWINSDKISNLGIQTGITFDVKRIRLARKKQVDEW